MNIIIACDGLLSGKGGMERLAVELANEFSKLHKVFLVYTIKGEQSYEINEGIDVHYIDLNNIDKNKEILLDFDCDAYIYFYTNHKLLDHISLAKLLDAKIIVTESASPMRIHYNNWLHNGRKSPLFAAYERFSALRYVDSIRVEVAESVEYFPAFLKEKVVYFPNGTQYAHKDNKYKKNNFEKRLLIVGAGKPHKRFDVALKALKEVIAQDKDVILVVAGYLNKASKYVQKCFTYIEENNLENNIEFVGMIDDMDTIYETCDIHLICSADESFGLVTIESMCFGLPTIGCQESIGTRNLVEDGKNGLLYNEADDYMELSALIMELISDQERYKLLSNAAFLSSKKYSNQEYYKHWNLLLKNIINNKSQKCENSIDCFLKDFAFESKKNIT